MAPRRSLLLSGLLVCASARAALPNVGFFMPTDLDPKSIDKTRFAVILAASPEQVEAALTQAEANGVRVHLCLGPKLTTPAPAAAMPTECVTSSGRTHRKWLAALPTQKALRVLPPDALRSAMDPYVKAISRHRKAVGTLFLADEPYLNGIDKDALEALARTASAVLDEGGAAGVPLGVNFDSMSFDPEFARHLYSGQCDYVAGIDAYHEGQQALVSASRSPTSAAAKELENWVAVMTAGRLTSYDLAGFSYTSGGIPRGYDVVSFDFYLSTLLMDRTHETTLGWLATRFPRGPCARFAAAPEKPLKSYVSFFGPPPHSRSTATDRADSAVLDDAFACRISSARQLLQRQLDAQQLSKVEIMLWTESSGNGLREFSETGAPLPETERATVERRVRDEVVRARRYQAAHPNDFPGGLIFFLFRDAFDSSISAPQYGAASMPSVLEEVWAPAARYAKPAAASRDSGSAPGR